nr:BA14K family protein [uncultured Cohaesibacter sp.]
MIMKLVYTVAVALILSAFGSLTLPSGSAYAFGPPPPGWGAPPPRPYWRRPPPRNYWRPPVRRWAPPPPPRWAPPPPRRIYRGPVGYCNIPACAASYRSFRAWDCSYQPYGGPRRRCRM